jgi:hypothetical protein
MADNITADPTITGSPGVTTPAPGTYALGGKNYKLGIPEQLQANQANNTLTTNRALRSYQENAAAMQLRQNLSTIDRTALDAYKGVANNYAARGMLRSGGYQAADDKVYADTQDTKTSLVQGLQDLLNTNKITDTGEQQSRDNAIQQLIAQFIGTDAGKKLNEIKG